MTIIQPGILEILPDYSDWWNSQNASAQTGETQQKGIKIRIQPNQYKGYQILQNGQLVAQVQRKQLIQLPMPRYYTVVCDNQEFRFDTSASSSDKRERITDGHSQAIAEYHYNQQNQAIALVVRKHTYALGAGWGDTRQTYRYLNDADGTPLIRMRMRTNQDTAVQMVEVFKTLPSELVVFAVMFAESVPYKPEDTTEVTADGYRLGQQSLFDLPELHPGTIEFIPTPYKTPQRYLVVNKDQSLATVEIHRSGPWSLGGKHFECTVGNFTYRTKTSPRFSTTKEFLTDAQDNVVAAFTLQSARKIPTLVYGENAYKLDSEWFSGEFRRVYDAQDTPLFMVKASYSGVDRVDLYQSVAGGLALAAGILALTNDYRDSSG